ALQCTRPAYPESSASPKGTTRSRTVPGFSASNIGEAGSERAMDPRASDMGGSAYARGGVMVRSAPPRMHERTRAIHSRASDMGGSAYARGGGMGRYGPHRIHGRR